MMMVDPERITILKWKTAKKKIHPFIKTFLLGILVGTMLFITFGEGHGAQEVVIERIHYVYKTRVGGAKRYRRYINVVYTKDNTFLTGREERRYKNAIRKRNHEQRKGQ